MEILKTDLNAITGKSPMFTVVEIADRFDRNFEWIVCGETSLSNRADRVWTLGAYLDKATDGDHDAAYAFRFTLIGLEFEFMNSGTTHFTGWISSRDDYSDDDRHGEFRVPRNGEYNPAKDAKECKRCKGKDKHVFAGAVLMSKNVS